MNEITSFPLTPPPFPSLNALFSTHPSCLTNLCSYDSPSCCCCCCCLFYQLFCPLACLLISFNSVIPNFSLHKEIFLQMSWWINFWIKRPLPPTTTPQPTGSKDHKLHLNWSGQPQRWTHITSSASDACALPPTTYPSHSSAPHVVPSVLMATGYSLSIYKPELPISSLSLLACQIPILLTSLISFCVLSLFVLMFGVNLKPPLLAETRGKTWNW